MKLNNCRRCFHHMDRREEEIICRFWGEQYSRKLMADGDSTRVISCPRLNL